MNLDPQTAQWLGGFLIAIFGWMLKRTISRVDGKADHEVMAREIARLEMQLQDAREARERDNERAEEARTRDNERIERANAEKLAEFSEAMRDRFNSLERHIDQRFGMLLEAVRPGGQK